ncbi:CSC1-like protein HYP1 isoform X3 [Vitis vinifera]|uniref:CSC1-like protein HYP1 isoform X3 n=1 Tax=Vitis vinifera TaxID=29760 RepID=UPI00053FE0C2|nr:CSC1-like protein HYP1 isoform X3 [Vitis vinifera]|eukprot:XP_010661094.1 PREDICTED: CSC1-like protein HYP1 isoform X3 [Vitis vinifera]
MILSALLTSVGINLGLCFLFFTLYSILRKQPGNIHVYAPRLVAEGKSQRTNHFNLDRLLPSAGWVTRAWQPSEEDLLSTSGLDAVVFMRIFIFSLRVFTFAGIIGVFILLPINYLGNQLSIDFSDLPNKSLDSFSISNVDNGSNRLWIHFSAAYVFTGVVCYLLYFEYSYISSKRIAWFYHSKPQPHQFTILVSGIPVSSGSRVGESVESFFTKYHPSTYLSHTVVRRTNKLQKVIEVRAAFVSFKSRFGAAIALHIQQGIDPTEWVTERAPEPQDVYWPFFSASFLKRWICKLVFVVAYILLTVSFLIPVVIVQGLTHLDQLEVWFPFLRGVLTITFVSQVITGYLPSLILQLFLSLVPPIMIIFSSMQGYISFSKIQKSACTKMLWFTIWNIFFANVLSGSVLYQVNIILEPKEIPKILAEVVPAQASFFIAYVVTSGWTSLSSEIFRMFPLICSFVKQHFTGNDGEEFQVPSIPYHKEIPTILFFGLLGVTYFFLAPLILPFLLVYFCLAYIVYRNQLLNVFAPKYETGGKFWPIVHNSTIFSLVLMHIIAIGIFGLKKLPLASSLTIPLPVLTLLFNEFCRKRFLPIFRDYSAECLINKDREDQRDPTMVEFRDKLVTAYQDPALKPIQYSGSIGRLKSPLLHSAVA